MNTTGLSYNTSSSSGKWQAECSINYSRLGIIAGTPKTVGVEFRNYDDASGWYNYPTGGAELIPDTWADMSITFVNSITRGTEPENIVKVYPNPVKDLLSIEKPKPATTEILNIQGQLLKTLEPGNTNTNLDVSGLPAGVYFVRIITDKEFVTLKLLKL